MALVFWVHFFVVYFVTDACLLCCVLVFRYLAKRLAGKNVSEITYFVPGGTQNLNSINLVSLFVSFYNLHTTF